MSRSRGVHDRTNRWQIASNLLNMRNRKYPTTVVSFTPNRTPMRMLRKVHIGMPVVPSSSEGIKERGMIQSVPGGSREAKGQAA